MAVPAVSETATRCANSAEAAPASSGGTPATPAASRRALPSLRVSLGTATATAKLASVIGRNATPACTGL